MADKKTIVFLGLFLCVFISVKFVSVWANDAEHFVYPVEYMQSVTSAESGDTALIKAAKQGDTQTVQSLIASGDNINATNDDGDTALLAAAENGQLEVVNILLAAGADTNIRSQDDGDTAMSAAKKHGHTKIVDLLRQYGAQ